jgi:NAD+ synthase
MSAALTIPSKTLIISLAQLNPTVGDVGGNLILARHAREWAKAHNADLIVFSELFLSGYPPEDLVLKPAFQDACLKACEDLAHDTRDDGPQVLIGLPYVRNGQLFNAYALLKEGRIADIRFKVDLPNYGVFDEKRVFTAGPLPDPIVVNEFRIGVPICEDIWTPHIVAHLRSQHLDLLIVPNGSPYWREKTVERLRICQKRAAQAGVPLVYLNQVGGQDELVFDGGSLIVHPEGDVPLQMRSFATQQISCTLEKKRQGVRVSSPEEHTLPDLDADQADYTACMLGLRDYVKKNRFQGVVLGVVRRY